MSQIQNVGVWSELLEAVEDFNKRFFITSKTLLTQPQHVLQEISAENPSKEYVPAVKYAFLIMSFYAVSAAFLGINFTTLGPVINNEQQGIDILWQFLDKSIVFLTLLSLLPTAWLVSKLFSASGQSSLNCYKISLYAYSLATIAVLIVVAPVKWLFPELSNEDTLALISYLGIASVVCVGWIYCRCFAVGFWEGTWKTIVSYLWCQVIAIALFAVFSFVVGFYVGYSETINTPETSIEAAKG
ncbi:hypothetical protein [Planctobacterium marinum]|uniref:Yip1 domain-containing protein n=1 Tax=Planctobacterium marinum TaxID=1631968 RepID=A0AA48KT79_9ALTE|nr:hypothetical protein MACH26_34430 [Planctobacterium marinum]